GNPIIARGRLNPYILEASLPRDSPIGDAIEGHPAGHTQILGASRFPQPDRALEQQCLRVVLNPPSNILPMLHRRTGFPVPLVLRKEWFIEVATPLGDIHL